MIVSPKPLVLSVQRILALAAILLVFLSSIAWTHKPGELAPLPQASATIQASQPANPTATPTRFPEYATNQDQTNGIVLGSTILVLIILIGTMTVIRAGERSRTRMK